MKTEQLITMANQIGAFFNPYPDHEQVQKDIARHLNRYWALSMRKQIVLYVEEKAGAGLEANVIEAIKSHVKL